MKEPAGIQTGLLHKRRRWHGDLACGLLQWHATQIGSYGKVNAGVNATRVVLRAYYEQLYEKLEAAQARLDPLVDELLPAEIERQRFGPLTAEKVQAYREAVWAFIGERLEMYNPIGIQYTFSGPTTARAAELEFQLNWYDSRQEFQELIVAAQALAGDNASDEQLPELAEELIRQVGAYPDRSIIAAYAVKPTLQRLPDFIVASAIEQVLCG